MVSDKQEEATALEMKLQVLDKDLNWKKEVVNFLMNQINSCNRECLVSL